LSHQQLNNKGQINVTAHTPPVPPANRTKIDSDQRALKRPGEMAQAKRKPLEDQQGHQSNISRNTTNPGYQQDR
jgi:hypothetical protein